MYYVSAVVSVQGSIVLTLLDASTNTWICNGAAAHYAGNTVANTIGSKSLAGVLDRVQLWAGGTDTFDAGKINVMYEG